MLKEEEISLLISDLLEHYGYDFNSYSRDSLKRRLSKIFRLEKFTSFEEFRNKILTDEGYIEHLVDRLTVNVTQMFRDSDFFTEIRKTILPELSALPQIRIWHAGCSTGEEVISLAILLFEAGLLHKTIIDATDINSIVLEKALNGIYPLSLLKLYERNYISSGGKASFSTYYTVINETSAKFKNFLTAGVTFTPHNLASDIYINKFNLIVCRNVLIYFDKELRERVFNLFDLSLVPNGYLALGEKETLKSSAIVEHYSQPTKEKIWKKIN